MTTVRDPWKRFRVLRSDAAAPRTVVRGASSPRRATGTTLVALLSALLAAGCSRLSGDHAADQDDEQTATMERLLDDAPESLRRKPGAANAESNRSSATHVVADDAERVVPRPPRPVSQKLAAEEPVTVAKPVARARPKKTPAAGKADDIPDAAEVGL